MKETRRNSGTEEKYCAVHIVGDIELGGGILMIEKETVGRIRCFICGNEAPSGEIVVMSFNRDDMVCVCKKHVKTQIMGENLEDHRLPLEAES